MKKLLCVLQIWANFKEEKEEVVPENEPQERKINYKTCIVTEVGQDLKFFAQDCETGVCLLHRLSK